MEEELKQLKKQYNELRRKIYKLDKTTKEKQMIYNFNYYKKKVGAINDGK